MSKKVTDSLCKLLANSYFLYLKTQNYHWNVTGVHFSSLHEMFQKQYEDLAESNDEIAERMRAIGVFVQGNINHFEKHRIIKDAKDDLDWKKMVKDLHDSHLIMLKIVHEVMTAASKEKDEATVDLMVQRLHVHEKAVWMMGAILA